MSDLPDVLREFSRREAYFDPSGITRLIDISASLADSYPDLANRASFVVVPAELGRNAESALPINDATAPSAASLRGELRDQLQREAIAVRAPCPGRL